jgi:hypothetical protein
MDHWAGMKQFKIASVCYFQSNGNQSIPNFPHTGPMMTQRPNVLHPESVKMSVFQIVEPIGLFFKIWCKGRGVAMPYRQLFCLTLGPML